MGCSCSSQKSCSPAQTLRSISTAPLSAKFKIDTKPCRYSRMPINLRNTYESTIMKRRSEMAQNNKIKNSDQQ